MAELPLPSEVDDISILRDGLDAATQDERIAWMRRLDGKQMLKLYDLAAGTIVTPDELASGAMVIHHGKNGMPMFNRFQKRFAVTNDGQKVGFNWNKEIAGPLSPIVGFFTGPGHYSFYASPDVEGEVWVDYRTVPTTRHPEFPPLKDNDHGLRSLVFGNMVDIIRRVSTHVFIGNSFKDLEPPRPLTLGCKIGSMMQTAPFVLVQDAGT